MVSDNGSTPETHTQHYGICQGCPLSPFFLVMVMIVLLHDAKNDIEEAEGTKFAENMIVNELVYADDTLLIDVHGEILQNLWTQSQKLGSNMGWFLIGGN